MTSWLDRNYWYVIYMLQFTYMTAVVIEKLSGLNYEIQMYNM